MTRLHTHTHTVIIALALLSGGSAQAQPARDVNVDALRISFITRKLNLTPDEAKVFWPVFNEFEAELKKVREKKRELGKSVTDWSALSEEEVKKHMDQVLDLDQKELDLKKTYTAKLYEVIPPYKVVLLYRTVEDFKMWLINQARQKRPGPRDR